RETILLVEDDPAILAISRTMLERLAYRVVGARSPDAALQLARDHAGPIHLLMTDVVMPGMNGHDLAARLLDPHPHIKRLYMSGYTADVIAHHGILDDGIHFIQKPFTLAELEAKVRETLDDPRN
ncbi:MAG: response regulator, partial [Opitutae bacterium]|nr:response regulator [Opitutae bacterium]